MGFFSSDEEAFVASVIYNLAGANADRINYRKTSAINIALSGVSDLSGALVHNMINGPASKQLAFHRWAKNNYTVGLPEASRFDAKITNTSIIVPFIPREGDEDIWIQAATFGLADARYFAERYLAKNHPDLVGRLWNAEINSVTKVMRITFPNTSIDPIIFTATGFNKNDKYIYVKFSRVFPGTVTGLTIGPTSEWTRDYGDVPSITDYTLNSTTFGDDQTRELYTRYDTVITYSDGRPDETSTTQDDSILITNRTTRNYRWRRFIGGSAGSLRYRENYLTVVERFYEYFTTEENTTEEDIGGGVIRTVYTTTTRKLLGSEWQWQLTVEDSTEKNILRPELYMYRIGSGNPILDAVERFVGYASNTFPIIPIRMNNYFVDHYEEVFPEAVADAYKAYKKATGSDLDDFIDILDDNESIGDIDFAFFTYGVTLNERDAACKRYIYNYLQSLMDGQNSTREDFYTYRENLVFFTQVRANWNEWANAQLDENHPRYGQPEPTRPTLSDFAYSNYSLRCSHPILNDLRIITSWSYIHETLNIGVGRPGAEAGDVWFVFDEIPVDDLNLTDEEIFTGSNQNIYNLFTRRSLMLIYYQDSPNTFKVLEVLALFQKNFIYDGESTSQSARQALDTPLEESEFFLPMNSVVLKSMSKKDQNQIAVSNQLLILNSYKVVKTRWYQRGFFRVIFAFALIIVMVIINPTALAAAPGILGANAAVGAAIGFAAGSTLAIVAGAVANAIVAALLMRIISPVVTNVFGEEIGAIINTALSWVVSSGKLPTSFQNLAVNWAELVKPQNLMRMTEVVAAGYKAYVAEDIAGMQTEFDSYKEQYMKDMDEVDKLTEELLGDSAYIDPTVLTDSVRNQNVIESSESFLTRTLLTGSDIADISHRMISEFVELSLVLPKGI